MLDLYCERAGPGLWAEPVNALSNLAYLVAARAAWRLAAPAPRPDTRVLAVLIAAIGLGSALFHTLATPWARLLDEAPILVFELTALWWYSRRVMRLTPVGAAPLLVGFLGAIAAARQLPHVLNGSLVYAPALLATVALGVYHARTQPRARPALVAAAAVLAAAVVLRTIDHAVCPAFPVGTHFLWHLLTAYALYLFTWGLAANLR